MQFIERSIESDIKERLFQGKILVLYGARQVGKTTLVKKILADFKVKDGYFNCEEVSVQNGLAVAEASVLRTFLGKRKIVVLDEAQHIPDIGRKLKILIDTYPDMRIIATGSSSFELANRMAEPLTGRAFHFTLYPFSYEEITASGNLLIDAEDLEHILRFGSYPEVFHLSEEQAQERLDTLASAYLYKDTLRFDDIKKSSLVRDLLKLVALQLGQEVSYYELSRELGVSRQTVVKYLDVLEQSFVIFTLRAFSRNLRKEIKKSVKIYFYDTGIRNGLIQNYHQLSLRDDVGALWENYCIAERQKRNSSHSRKVNSYFWRTYEQKEIDYIEEEGGRLQAYEFKWNPKKKARVPAEFVSVYGAEYAVINTSNYRGFLAG
jgi:predicted AAA+ superfamily ATPase